MSESATAIADRLTKRRSRLMLFLAIYFMVSQGALIDRQAGLDAASTVRTVDAVHISAWFAMALALLLLLLTGGGLFRSREVRSLLNDETTTVNRRKAMAIGFGNAMVTCIVLYVLTFFQTVGGREAVHIIMSVAIGSALIVFALEERRALKDG